MHSLFKRLVLTITLFVATGRLCVAQNALTEGTVRYNLKLVDKDAQEFAGTFLLTVKNGWVRKDITLSNGFSYLLIIDCMSNKAYSLKTVNGVGYAIQIAMAELYAKQKPFDGFVLANNTTDAGNIGGQAATKGIVTYTDGSTSSLHYTTAWYLEKGIAFERFPAARFLPLEYTYSDEAGSRMYLKAESVSAAPVEESMFKIPNSYIMISSAEFKKL
jgi:hypothetical protein